MAKSGRNEQLRRILEIVRDLDRAGGIDLYELARKHGTTDRTIRRDLQAIAEVGVRVVEEEGEGSRKKWRLDETRQLERLRGVLDASHYLALRIAMGQGGAVRSSDMVFAQLEDLAARIEAAVGKGERTTLEAIDRCFYSYEKFAWRSAPVDVVFPLAKAIREGRLCKVAYATPHGEPREHRVLPLKLFVHQGAAYLFAQWARHGYVGTLNLHRLRSVELLDEKRPPPADFDPQKWEAAAFGIFEGGVRTRHRLRFDAEVAPYLKERTWHPSQVITDERGGAVELTFVCAAGYEVESWVASWREHVEVLEPKSLRKKMAALGRWLAATYAPADGERAAPAQGPGSLREWRARRGRRAKGARRRVPSSRVAASEKVWGGKESEGPMLCQGCHATRLMRCAKCGVVYCPRCDGARLQTRCPKCRGQGKPA